MIQIHQRPPRSFREAGLEGVAMSVESRVQGIEGRAAYPAEEERDVVLRSGATIRLRPIRPEDSDELLGFYRRLSPESLYFRFFSVPTPEAARAACLGGVDYQNRFALVAEAGPRIVGVAHYDRDPERTEHARVAFTVEDSAQGQGIGTKLLERLAEIARARRITTFEADMLRHNDRMLDVFRNTGFSIRRSSAAGRERVIFPIAPTPAYEEKAATRSDSATAASIAPLFSPRSVAVVGASHTRGKIGAEIFHNLLAAEFQGDLYPVNPGAAEVQGRPSFARVSDIPGVVDLAVIAVPAAAVDAALDDCIAKKVKAVVVITAGFAETGEEGRRREQALLEKVRAAGIRMVGPNCMGLVSTDPKVRLNAQFAPVYPPAGNVALSSQSGALGIALLEHASRLNLGVSSFVSVGNKADVSSNDLIQYWMEDPRTDVILLYLESFGNPVRFSRIARRVGRRKPIVAVKAGRSAAGARAAASHTGALAQSDAVVDALFRQAGVIRTRTLEELFEVATLLAHQPIPRGARVAILTNAGGPGILAADVCEGKGLALPALSGETRARLREMLPPTASIGNPVDMIASASPEHYEKSLELLLRDPNIDSVLVIFIPPIAIDPEAVARAIVKASESADGKPVVAIFMSAKGAPRVLAPIPSFPFPESAARALAHVLEYGRWLKEPRGDVPSFPDIRPEDARQIVARSLEHGGGWLAPEETDRLLCAFGIATAPPRLARTAEEAVAAAAAAGFPVAMKAVGPEIIHKTEVGGVRLGLEDDEAVREAFADLKGRLASRLSEVLIQPMVSGGVEVIVGLTQDPTFGPLVLYGSGGTLVEVISDVTFRLQPLTDADAGRMLDDVRGTALLRGFRGHPVMDEAALKGLILRVSALAEACPEITEMDLNPVMVLPRGARVVDARVRIGRRPVAPPSRRIAD
jgi:acetyl coenzyme A synthetase (ADP forming)-like protein